MKHLHEIVCALLHSSPELLPLIRAACAALLACMRQLQGAQRRLTILPCAQPPMLHTLPIGLQENPAEARLDSGCALGPHKGLHFRNCRLMLVMQTSRTTGGVGTADLTGTQVRVEGPPLPAAVPPAPAGLGRPAPPR